MSGPLVLSASAHIRDMKKYGYRVCIDLKPALPPEKLYKRVSEDFALLANREEMCIRDSDCTRANTLLFCNGNTRLCLPAAAFSKATRE